MQLLPCRFGVVIALLAASSFAGAQQSPLARGLVLFENGEVNSARAVFAEILENEPDHAEAAYHLGMTQMELDELDPAIESFERAVELDDKQSRYHQRLGEALGSKAGEVGVLKQMGLAGRIHDAFERAVDLDADNVEARLGLITFYVNAPAIAGGSEAKALQQAEAIFDRNEALGHRALAMVYVQQGAHEKAEAAYRAALAAEPLERDTYLEFGIYLTEQQRYAEAMEVFDAWLESHPDDMNINYQVGRTASISGSFLELGRAAMQAYATRHKPKPGEPSLAWASYRLGLILQQLDDAGAARQAFEQALALDPKHKPAKKALRRMR